MTKGKEAICKCGRKIRWDWELDTLKAGDKVCRTVDLFEAIGNDENNEDDILTIQQCPCGEIVGGYWNGKGIVFNTSDFKDVDFQDEINSVSMKMGDR